MIALVGIKRDIPIQIREGFSIKKSKKEFILQELLKKFNEVVLVSTCNRTEIYINNSHESVEILKEIFEIVGWDESLIPFAFYTEGKKVSKHLLEVACGYHSKIAGEDQILGQIKEAYRESQNIGGANKELGRLFQEAITCGKKFRTETKLYEIPVSSVSIVVNKLVKEHCQRVMVIGYGEIGKLAIKYLLGHNIEEICLVVRNPEKVDDLTGTNVKIMTFKEKQNCINYMDCIISCTSAPHPVVLENDIKKDGNSLMIFDMAVPRDVEAGVNLIERTSVYNIDEISGIDDDNKALRLEKMKAYKYIVDEYVKEYEDWKSLRELSPIIRELKDKGNENFSRRIVTYENKSKAKEDHDLVEMLLKSTSDLYINRAIEVLKEEKLRGCEEECLRIIKKIFLVEK
ncbi:glutamyl-tRNA reductase [Clostridium paraputrificum]|uniref:glutamyl-tRNA reductase n=1 Tax=Clostridium TaxID=1485 RepID=UPI003D328D5D